nr:hypothetical protein Iba_chr04bCG12650 [Ipomoea batatas]
MRLAKTLSGITFAICMITGTEEEIAIVLAGKTIRLSFLSASSKVQMNKAEFAHLWPGNQSRSMRNDKTERKADVWRGGRRSFRGVDLVMSSGYSIIFILLVCSAVVYMRSITFCSSREFYRETQEDGVAISIKAIWTNGWSEMMVSFVSGMGSFMRVERPPLSLLAWRVSFDGGFVRSDVRSCSMRCLNVCGRWFDEPREFRMDMYLGSVTLASHVELQNPVSRRMPSFDLTRVLLLRMFVA